PAGGLFVWLTLDGMDTGPGGPLVPAALEAGVLYVPGEFSHVPDEAGRGPRGECRLGFGVASPEQIAEGIRRVRRGGRGGGADGGGHPPVAAGVSECGRCGEEGEGRGVRRTRL